MSAVRFERFYAVADQVVGCGHVLAAGDELAEITFDGGRTTTWCAACVDSIGHAISAERSAEWVPPLWMPRSPGNETGPWRPRILRGQGDGERE